MQKFIFTQMLIASTSWLWAQNPVGTFSNHTDIGKPVLSGGASYSADDQTYQLKGAGYNIWFGRDEFHYAYNKVKGDFILTGNFKLTGKGVDPHRKMGWMVRATDTDDAAHMTATAHDDGLVALQWRTTRGAYMRDPQDEIFATKKGAEIIQLERSGTVFIMRVAHAGEPLQEVGRTNAVDLPNDVLAGIFISSHNAKVVEEGMVWNVRIEHTVPDNYNGYTEDVLGSRLEIINVFNGRRKVVYQDKGRFEAPNWMPDGKNILFNQGGNIYTVPVSNGIATLLNTGNANKNNNDHTISFDGKMLGISSHREGMPGGGSTVYVLPLSGGKPILVTDSTPSYLHGWSPNGKEVVYTAQRISNSPAYNIYKKPVNGGAEVQLTFNQQGLADGPEYSPDGKYIYYNDTKSGTMQLWRMKPDGSNPEQLTFDQYNNWFAHISPDGKMIAFLTFPETVNPGDHPFYKRVMLRLMPAAGGAPKVIAYLYGGQGTINTPSWSPDSQHLAFVSNSANVLQ